MTGQEQIDIGPAFTDAELEPFRQLIRDNLAHPGRWSEAGVEVTPAYAQALMEHWDQERQRPMFVKTVNLYAAQMRANQWHLGGTSIKVDTEGKLINGGHRLEALSLQTDWELGFLFDFIWNAHPGEFQTEDQGRNRSRGDLLAAKGFSEYRTQVAACTGLLWRYQYHRQAFRKWSHLQPTPDDFMSLAEAWRPEIVETITEWPRLTRIKVNGTAAVVFYIAAQRAWPAGRSELQAYMAELMYGEHVGRSDPAYTIREYLRTADEKGRKKKTLSTQAWHLWMLLRGWEARCHDRVLDRIPVPDPMRMVMPAPYKGTPGRA